MRLQQLTLPTLRAFRYTQEMEKPELQLRLLQGGCLLFLVICILSCILEHLGVWNLLVEN